MIVSSGVWDEGGKRLVLISNDASWLSTGTKITDFL